MTRRHGPPFFVLVLLSALLLFGCGESLKGEISVAAASAMRGPMPDLIKAYSSKNPGVTVTMAFGGSMDLRKRIEGGTPIDGVIFGNSKPVDDLIIAGRVDARSRRVVATNKLVLVTPADAKRVNTPLTFATIASLPEGAKLAIGDPSSATVGLYAREALQKLGVWDALQSRLVLGSESVAVVAHVRRGEVAAAIVYKTDIKGVNDVIILDEAKAPWVSRVEVVTGVVKGSKGEARVRPFLDFIASAEGQKILADHGFSPP